MKYLNLVLLDIGLNTFETLNLWAPVKVIIDTPLGGFVLKGTALKN